MTQRISPFWMIASAFWGAAACVACGGNPKSSGSPTVSATGGAGASGTGVGGASNTGGGGDGSVAQAGQPSVVIVIAPSGGSGGTGGDAGNILASTTLPDGFTPANMFGGFKVGAEISSGGTGGDDAGSSGGTGGASNSCGTTILAVIRDFQADGKNFEGQGRGGDDRGMVETQLGSDRKPVFAHTTPTKTVADPTQLDSWYRNVDGLNKPFELQLWFGPNAGVSSFESTAFFPLDGLGWGDDGLDDSGVMHNFHFTTEIHTSFKYQGGEKFNFTGDDDVWVFINNQLVIDLGGVHVAETDSVDLDMAASQLGLVKGQIYPFDMFQNERHTSQSNFRADTDLYFVDCGTIVPDAPPQ